jgi:hypothetical protein
VRFGKRDFINKNARQWLAGRFAFGGDGPSNYPT